MFDLLPRDDYCRPTELPGSFGPSRPPVVIQLLSFRPSRPPVLIACRVASSRPPCTHPRRCVELPGAAPQRGGNPAWQNFVHHMAKEGLTRAQWTERWRALDQTEKGKWNDAPAPPLKKPRQQLERSNKNGEDVWPHIGDSEFPVRESLLSSTSRSVKPLAAAGEKRIGKGSLGTPTMAIDVKHTTTCEKRFGVGQCSKNLSQESKAAFDVCEGMARQWCGFHPTSDGKVDEDPMRLGLMFFGPAGDAPAGHADGPEGVVALLLFINLTPLSGTCLVRNSMLPEVGQVVSFEVSAATLQRTTQLIWTGGVQTSIPLAIANVRTQSRVKSPGSRPIPWAPWRVMI